MGFASYFEDITLAACERECFSSPAVYQLPSSGTRVPVPTLTRAACECPFCRDESAHMRTSSSTFRTMEPVTTPFPFRKDSEEHSGNNTSKIAPSGFLKSLYRDLRIECKKMANYVQRRLATGDWRQIAKKLDWHVHEWDEVTHGEAKRPLRDSIDRSKNLLTGLDHLVCSARSVVKELEVFISVIEQAAERLVEQKGHEAQATAGTAEVAIEEDAIWLLHGWYELRQEANDLEKRAKELGLRANDELFERMMEEGGRTYKP